MRQVMGDLSKRVQAAEAVRDQLWKENAFLRSEVAAATSTGQAASITQRSKAAGGLSTSSTGQRAVGSPMSDTVDVEAQDDDNDTEPFIRKPPFLLRTLPHLEVCLNHAR